MRINRSIISNQSESTPVTRSLTIDGVTYDLSQDRTWTTTGSGGSVTSVDMTVPTGLSISGNPITTSGTLALTFAAGYSIPLNTKQSNWDDAYTFTSAFPSQTGNSGKYLTTDGSVLSWGTISILSGSGTTNYISKFTGSTSFGNSQIFDDGTYVGIGTASPSYKLQISAPSATNSDIFLAGMSGVSNGFTIRRVSSAFVYAMVDGNLGLGNTTPEARLRVSGTYNGTQATFGVVDGRGLEIATLFTSGTNEAGSVLNARGAGAGTLVLQTESTERLRITSTGSVQITGDQYITHSKNYSSGAFQSSTIDSTLAVPNAASISSGITLSALFPSFVVNFAGSVTIPSGSTLTSQRVQSYYNFTGSGTTTITQATGIRAATVISSLPNFGGSSSGTITHHANMMLFGYYNQNSGTITPTITNAYQLLINDINEFSHTFTFTKRWAIYQNGSSDNNYFKGKVIIGSTDTVGNSPLNVKGLPTSSAGLSTGDIWNDAGTLKIV